VLQEANVSDHLYDLSEKDETKMMIAITVITLSVLLYLGISVYEKSKIEPDETAVTSTSETKLNAVSAMFQK